jgi:hypothetical protein
MRTSFDFKIVAYDYRSALEVAKDRVSSFLSIPIEEVDERVDLELKVSLPKAETKEEILTTINDNFFVVHVFGSVKRSMSKPFGSQ